MIKLILAAALIAAPGIAHAEIKAQSDTGFNIVHIATVDAEPDVIWKRLITPKEYWNKTHSWSGSVDGFYIDAQAGGCFCEVFQEKGSNGKFKNAGTVEHMRVIFAQPAKVLRMQGALGPLQSEAVLGTLTVALEPAKDKAGTTVSFSYVVGGYMRYKVSDIAPAVDAVFAEQFASLIKPYRATGTAESELAAPKKDEEWSLDLEDLNAGTKPSPPASAKKPSPAAKKNTPAVKKSSGNTADPKKER